jgi:hypothetical protein
MAHKGVVRENWRIGRGCFEDKYAKIGNYSERIVENCVYDKIFSR